MSSTLSTSTKFSGLSDDHFFAPPTAGGVGTPVLIDRDQDAQITLADGASVKELQFYTNAEVTARLGIQLKEDEVEISTSELEVGSQIRIDGTTIGTVAQYDGSLLVFNFIEATTPEDVDALKAKVEKLIKALAYTNLSTAASSPGFYAGLLIIDNKEGGDDALIYAADRFHGDNDDSIIEIDNGHLSRGDEIDGGDGHDTLQLTSGGMAHFDWLSKFDNVEVVLGSNHDDSIYLSSTQIAKLTRIDGGGQAKDSLTIGGGAIDLKGISISSFSSISYGGVGTTIIVDNVSVAKMLDGKLATDETLTIAGGALTDVERLALHRKGIDFIVHNGRRTTIADVDDSNPTIPITLPVDRPLMRTGTRGKDVISGMGGNDTLNGGYGNDILAGWLGADQFVFNAKLGTWKTNRKVNFDTIIDFKTGEDKILLDNAIFKNLGRGRMDAPGALNKKFFKKTKATDKNDYLIYKSGVLSYDADGNGAKYKPIEIINIANKAVLSAADFLIV